MIEKTLLSQPIEPLVNKHGVVFIPDAIEKRFYGRQIKIMFDLIDKMSGRTLFKILGHEIAFFIKPENSSGSVSL